MALRRTFPEPKSYEDRTYRPVRFDSNDLRDVAAVFDALPINGETSYKTDEYETEELEDLVNYPKDSIPRVTIKKGVDFWLFVKPTSTQLTYYQATAGTTEAADKIAHIIESRQVAKLPYWLMRTGILWFLMYWLLFVAVVEVVDFESHQSAFLIAMGVLVVGMLAVIRWVHFPDPIRIRKGNIIEDNPTTVIGVATLLAGILAAGATWFTRS